ncbi:MAG: glycosyltransferase family 4 protein [Candidatus Pacearchaeota archaeon]
MKKIKVYLKKPWIFTDSPYYEYLTKNISPIIEYINVKNKNQWIIEDVKKFKMLNKLKRIIKLTIRNFFPWLPNASITFTKKDYDLIHCAHCLSINKKPWVMDVEYVNQFWAGGITKKQKKIILNLLKSKYCKKIIAWTEWTKKEILKEFPEVANKIDVVYPAIPIQKINKRDKKEINLLFVSRRFYFKGGLHALEVMDRLTKKYDKVSALVISDTPKEIIDKYSKNKKIKFFSVISKEKLFSEVYPKTDILVYPSYTDTFGFIILEALSFGIPIVTVGGQSRKDLISDGKTGFVIKEPEKFNIKDLENLDTLKDTIKKIEFKTEILIKNDRLRKKISKNALKEFIVGKFSINKRNKKLEKIYNEALKQNDNS